MKFIIEPIRIFFPSRLALLGWLGLFVGMVSVSIPSVAGTLYKCLGPNGAVAFTNKIGNFRNCLKVANYIDTPTTTKPVAMSPPVDQSVTPANDADATKSIASQNKAPMPIAAEKASVASTRVQRGAVYKVSRANGITEYTNIKPTAAAQAQLLFTYISNCYACDVHSNVDWDNTPLKVDAYRDEIAAASTQFGIDQALLRAVIHAESAFNPNAVSTKGAQGLMQLMPGTASDLEVSNPFDAGQNIRGGAHYLAMLLKDFNGDERLATAAYNAGAANVQKYGGIPPFDETRVYVDRVAVLRERYSAMR